jgi:TolB-like protein/Tfp pilus assembly protein PilF
VEEQGGQGDTAVESSDIGIRDPVARREPAADDVRAELERILSSPRFHASGKRRAFLKFIVEETLAGRADRLKGYTVAVDVFGRDERFHSQADPVVRLEARRLRRDLDSYYVDAGSRDSVRISIPKGSYVPHFEWHEVTQPFTVAGGEQATNSYVSSANGVSGVSTGPQRSITLPPRSLLVAALVVTVVTLATTVWLLNTENGRSVSNEDERGPGVVVLPFEALSSTDDSRYLASGISQELVANLTRFPGLRLYTLPNSFKKDASAEPAKLGRDLGVAYVVSGSVNANAEEIRVATQTVEAKSGRVLWSQTYDRALAPEALIRVQKDLASEIATALGQPYGVVGSDVNNRLATPAVANMQSYVCVQRAYGYRRSFSRKEFDTVLRCLEEAVRRDPDYSDAWAMLGWLHVDAGRIGYAGYNTQDEYKRALQAASEAVRLAPNSILALKVLGSVYHYLGRYDESERITRQALDINPYDPGTLAQLGWRLAVRGKFEEGIPMLKRAIARTMNPPGWYFHLIAIDLCLKGKYKRMREVAERADPDNSGVSQMLIAIANGALGNRDAARDALRKFSVHKPLASDPAAFLRRHGAINEIVDALMAGLKKARKVASGSQSGTM